MRRARKVRTLVLAVGLVLATMLPLLPARALVYLTAGVLLGYGSYRLGCFLYDAAVLYQEFKRWDRDTLAEFLWRLTGRRSRRLVR